MGQSFPADSDITSIVTTYDANGNVNTITETKGSHTEITRNDYDLLDRLTRQEQRGRVITYAYDNNGNRTSVASMGGSSTYTYDSRNRLATVVSGGTTTYQYYANNWLEQVSYANGTKAVYTYDQVGRVKTITNTLANNNVLSSFAYAYDSNGNRTQQVESQYGFLTVQTLTTDYGFDNLDRLEGYTETGSGQNKSHSFTYYPSYDRKTETVVSDGSTIKERRYHYNETYWLTRIDEAAGAGGAITYEYDNNGNSTRKTDTTSGSTIRTLFDYNSRNQLTRVAHGTPGNEVIQGTHDYNYAGMRIRHIGSERGDIEYLYDGNSILDELQNNTTNLVAHYRYGDRLLSLSHSGSDQFYHYAALGTTANLTNEQGQNQVAYRTDAFGEITQQEGSSVNRHVFTGQEHDEKTGLIYFGARFYDPDTARFINQDTYLGEGSTPPSLHRYLYAYANPTIYLDYKGNFPITEQVSAWLHQRAADNTAALKGVQKDHGSTIGTRSLAAISGIGAGLFSAAGGIVGLIDMGLDAQASNLRYIPGAENVSVIRESAEKTDRRREAVANFAIGAKDYITQENLTDALKRDGAKALDATGTYMGDVFVRGNLDATASWSGAMFEIAMTGATVRSAKLASQVDITPTLTDELVNINRGANNVPPVRNSPNSQLNSTLTGNSEIPNNASPNVPTYETPFSPLTKAQRADLKTKLESRTITREEYQQLDWDRRFANRRATGVRRFWAEERARLRAGEPGTRNWNPEQREAILAGGRPQFNGETIQGHHKYNALDHPQIANDPNNIYPATKTEHFERWHGGDWRNDTFGKPLNPEFLEEF